jgi:hypothetical protein
MQDIDIWCVAALLGPFFGRSVVSREESDDYRPASPSDHEHD